MTTATVPRRKIDLGVRLGALVVFGLVVLGLGAALGFAAPGRVAPDATVDLLAPAREPVPFSLVVVIVAIEAVLVGIGSVLVVAMVRDVRRSRHHLAVVPARDHTELDAVLAALSSAPDRERSADLLLDAVMALTPASDALVVMAVGDGTEVVATSAAVAELAGDPEVVGVLERGRPRRWVEASEGAAGRAFMAAPLRADGVVVGVVVGTRAGSTAFWLGDHDLVCQLAEVAVAGAPSLVDPVTTLPNRRRFDEDLERSLCGTDDVGLAVVGVDHLRRLRHRGGAALADDLLCEVGSILQANVRDGDVVYRYDDDRFGVLLPAADRAATADVAERLRAAVADHEFGAVPGTGTIGVTVSVGTTVSAGTGTATSAIETAGRALDAAERHGRNRVVSIDLR